MEKAGCGEGPGAFLRLGARAAAAWFLPSTIELSSKDEKESKVGIAHHFVRKEAGEYGHEGLKKKAATITRSAGKEAGEQDP
jgi:hypothetical protein